MLTIDNVDDAEEMRVTDEAFDILNFKKVRNWLDFSSKEFDFCQHLLKNFVFYRKKR